MKILFWVFLSLFHWDCSFSIEIEARYAEIAQILAVSLDSFLKLFSSIISNDCSILFRIKLRLSEASLWFFGVGLRRPWPIKGYYSPRRVSGGGSPLIVTKFKTDPYNLPSIPDHSHFESENKTPCQVKGKNSTYNPVYHDCLSQWFITTPKAFHSTIDLGKIQHHSQTIDFSS